MNKEEFKERMEKLGGKLKDSVDTAYILGLEAKDKLDVALDETKSSVNALKENYAIYSERAKGKASSKLIEAQMNIDAAKAEIEARKEVHDKEKLAKYIDDMVEYAEACAVLASLAAEEAKLASLEAAEAQKEYTEKYGE